MLFNSFGFLVFTTITFVIYYLPFLRRFQRFILVIASFTFYGYDQPGSFDLLVLSIGLNILFSRMAFSASPNQARWGMVLGVVANLSILVLFKYGLLISLTFFSDSLRNHWFVQKFTQSVLPVGISFFTFQGISLIVDAYRSRTNPALRVLPHRSGQYWLDVTLFKSFFPQLVSGPVVKAHDFFPQIATKYLKDIDWEMCFRQLVLGYFLKLVVADNLNDQTWWIAYPGFLWFEGWRLALLLFAYSIQIFADFAGYTSIALGVAGLFGYRLPKNFEFPYLASSFSDFWRRWHISLSSFLREYLYIPLGGNQKGHVRTYLNLMIVMILGGLWHGAAWSYAVWGLVHGLALSAERFIGNRIRLPQNHVVTIFKTLGVFLFVTLAWLLFKLNHLEHAAKYLQVIRRSWRVDFTDARFIEVALPIFFFSFPVVLYHAQSLFEDRTLIRIKKHAVEISFGLMLFFILLNSGMSETFIYFQF